MGQNNQKGGIMKLGRWSNKGHMATVAAAAVAIACVTAASQADSTASTDAPQLMDEQHPIETAAGKVLVPKRVRLIIDFRQTVTA